MQIAAQLTKIDSLLAQGALQEGDRQLCALLQVAPGSRDILLRLVNLALHTQRPAAALSYADQLLALDQADKDALLFKARAELACGNAAAALSVIERMDPLLSYKPAPYLLFRGQVLAANGNFLTAMQNFEAAIAADPRFAPAHESLDLLAHRTGNLVQAREIWRRCCERADAPALAWKKLAKVSSALGDADEARRCLEQAARMAPEDISTWYALGNLHVEACQFELARPCLERAVALDPRQEDCVALLGWVINELGDARGALSVLQAPPDAPVSFTRRVRHALLLPQIYESGEDVERWSRRFSDGLAALHAGLDAQFPDLQQIHQLSQTNFLLAYQGGDKLLQQREYAWLLRRLLVHARPDLVNGARPVKPRGSRITVAFVSSFLRECTIGHYFRSWIEDLDSATFERVVVYTGPQADGLTASIGAAADRFIHHRGGVFDLAQDILGLQPDIVIYPEVGMHSTNYWLANMRLAPVQCAAWGHPVTTGSDLIDYFFSCAEMEGPGADAHYVEKLLRLPGLGTRYALPDSTAGELSRASFSLSAEQHVYVCPQSLFKIHPDNDDLYLDILAADDKGVILFFQGSSRQITQAFAERIRLGMVRRGIAPRNQIKFVPRQGAQEFRTILSWADVVLDTVHWSGGNTSLDALSVGAPIVTLPGDFMRGRQSKAMLEMLGTPELIAASRADYVAMALRVAGDAGYRNALRQTILANRDKLFNREEPVLALAAHLERIYASSRQNVAA